jgi:hypothetical protein
MTALQLADCKRYSTGLVSVIYNAQLKTNRSPQGLQSSGQEKTATHRETLTLNAALRFVDAFAHLFD